MTLVTLLAFMPSLLLSAFAGVLADSVGKLIGTGSGRGTGFLIIIAGILLLCYFRNPVQFEIG